MGALAGEAHFGNDPVGLADAPRLCGRAGSRSGASQPFDGVEQGLGVDFGHGLDAEFADGRVDVGTEVGREQDDRVRVALARSSRAVSTPVFPGIIWSSTMASGGEAAAAARQASPRSTYSTVQPPALKIERRNLPMEWSSSHTSSRMSSGSERPTPS